jgi:hypothetical protein
MSSLLVTSELIPVLRCLMWLLESTVNALEESHAIPTVAVAKNNPNDGWHERAQGAEDEEKRVACLVVECCFVSWC